MSAGESAVGMSSGETPERRQLRCLAFQVRSLANRQHPAVRHSPSCRCLDLTVAWCRDRHTFGRPQASRQLVRHRLAEMATRTAAAGAIVGQVAVRDASGEPLVTEVAMAKNVAVAACDWVVDRAVQPHGGYGYLRDAEVERHYRDARIMGIGGGTTEIMNEIIAKGMGI